MFLSLNLCTWAQSTTDPHKGTIKVQKKGHLVKVVFDNVNYRLVGIDQYGNLQDTAVVEFEMSANIRGIFNSEKTSGSFLSKNMQELLQRCDQTSKLFFEKIKAKDLDGTIINMPRFQYSLGYTHEDSD
jgi:hypothetical protein